MNTKDAVELYLKEVASKYVDNPQVKPKSQSKLLKLIRPIAELFNKRFWEGYVTTIGSTIWVPDGWLETGSTRARLQTIAHETIHFRQHKRQTALGHGFLYFFPQGLAPLALLSLLAIPCGLPWLWSLLFLLLLAPIPAPFRYLKELEAYRMKIVFFTEVWSSSPDMVKWAENSIVKNLAKSDYYFCWPFPKMIRNHLRKQDKLLEKQYREAVEFMDRHGL